MDHSSLEQPILELEHSVLECWYATCIDKQKILKLKGLDL